MGFQDYLNRRKPPGLVDAALALGLPCFPCDANKRPLTDHGFKDATTDPDRLRVMFADPRAVMIGVPTGAATGFVVVDVDVKNGAQGGAWLDANSERFTQTRTIRTSSGGLHLCYIHPGQRVKNSASKIAPGVDVRGDGGYVIVPPSPGYAVADDAPLAEIPDWLLPALCPPEPAHAPPPQPRPLSSRGNLAERAELGGTILGRTALDQRCDEIRFAYDGAKHRAINEAGFAIGGLVAAGELDEAPALAELRQALASILLRCKDPRAAERTLARAFQEGLGRPQSVAERVSEPDAIHPAAELLARLQARLAPKLAKPIPVAPELMDVPGALRLFMDYCEATAISPQPFLSLAAGITMIGAMAGRRYRTTTDLRTNIYAVGIADSGAGKDHARKQIKRALYAAGLDQYLGGSDIASGSGLRTALLRHPAMLFQIDEFGDWLRDVVGEKASAHRKQIASMLKELYSSANLPWTGIEYADQSKAGRPREDIQSPHACLYGTTTPAQFWAAVSGASMHDGLMARVLLFASPCSYPDEQEPSLAEPSAELVEALQAIAAGAVEADDKLGNLAGLMSAATCPSPYTVPETPDATAARRALRQEQLDQQRQHEGTPASAILARLAENAMKLALIRAVARLPASPVIGADDVAWGRAVSLHCVDTLLREAAQHIADNDYEAKVNRAMHYVRKYGPVSSAEMFRNGWRLPERERTEILNNLVASGMVIATQRAPDPISGGRPTTRYMVNHTTTSEGVP